MASHNFLPSKPENNKSPGFSCSNSGNEGISGLGASYILAKWLILSIKYKVRMTNRSKIQEIMFIMKLLMRVSLSQLSQSLRRPLSKCHAVF